MNKNQFLAFTAALALGLAMIAPAHSQEEGEAPGKDRVVFDTNHGAITLELFPEEAPITVENFLTYVESGFYDDTVFHRVIPGFVIQGGGFTEEMQQKQTRAPIKNEADNGLNNERGTLSMARTQATHSATSQFFINLVDNENLDHGAMGFGYAVFARVVDGMDVVDKIARVPTGNSGMHQNVPREPVVVERAYVEGAE